MGQRVLSLLIFLSGPSDVEEQFVAAQRVVEAFNRAVGPHMGIVLRAVRGLTDAQAGRRRPQAAINPLVRQCDLFALVFARRFGSPTGRAASGSEEEFKIADRLARRTGKPHILLFFKDYRSGEVAEGGSQFQSVLRFRRQIDRRQTHYRLGYSTPIKFQMLFFEQLMQWVWGLREKPRRRNVTRPTRRSTRRGSTIATRSRRRTPSSSSRLGSR